MSALDDILQQTRTLHQRIAEDMGPLRLTCQECGYSEDPDAEHVASYLRHGWPRCCGRAMRVETVRDADAESV